MANARQASITIVRGKNGRTTLFIGRRPVKMRRKPLVLLACLLDDQGRVIPYKRLQALIGHMSDNEATRHLLRQHMSALREILLAHKAPYAIAVVKDVGYALCEIAVRSG